MKGIVLLQKAISKLRLFDSQLTSVHADLCHLCLLAKCFKPALQLLDIDITGICQEVLNDLFLYFFYSVAFFRSTIPQMDLILMQNTSYSIIIMEE